MGALVLEDTGPNGGLNEPIAGGFLSGEVNDRLTNAEIRIEAAQMEIQGLRNEEALAPKIKALVQQLQELAPVVIQHEKSLREIAARNGSAPVVDASSDVASAEGVIGRKVPAASDVKMLGTSFPTSTVAHGAPIAASTLPAPSQGR